MAEQRSTVRRHILRRLAAPLLALAALLGLRRRIKAGPGGRGGGDDGGAAGVREPRRPVPTPLIDAGAATRD